MSGSLICLISGTVHIKALIEKGGVLGTMVFHLKTAPIQTQEKILDALHGREFIATHGKTDGEMLNS